MILTEQIIEHKKKGRVLSAAQIRSFVEGITQQQVSNEQIAALAMAINFQGMNTQETTDLTLAMRDSGEYLKRKDIISDSPVVDKHSTGGVGDCVSLILAPLLASYGYNVPMIAGRGLGHTGGTIDKLESINGYTAEVSAAQLAKVVNTHGCAIVGQSQMLAPADKRFYAVRDTTATIDILPLIVASILSKKLSEGIDGLIMDIKVGNGAFMLNKSEASDLANRIKQTAENAGVKTTIQYNDMNQPLCPVAGNALEVKYVIEHLCGDIVESRLMTNVVDLAVELIQMFESTSAEQIKKQLRQLIHSGKVYEKFNAFLFDLGCRDIDNFISINYLKAKYNNHYEVTAGVSGTVKSINTKGIGNLLIKLKAGRQVVTDTIDPLAGLSHVPELGQTISTSDLIGKIHCDKGCYSKALEQEYLNCIEIA